MSFAIRTWPRKLVAYFRSGWAFFLPYLLAYLAYAGASWPVNPEPRGPSWKIPCLLYVFYVLHGVHLAAGAFALGEWIQAKGGQSATDRRLSDIICSLAPWACLALLFWVPGVFLEFPADPWEHYARVNGWAHFTTITSNPLWTKFSYFWAYSFSAWNSSPAIQTKCLDLYHTLCCLLLCWQFYRLGRSAGLNGRTSFLFVLLGVVTFGNNLFSFYRYYGISSTILAQLGAIAIIRIAIDTLGPKGSAATGISEWAGPPASFVNGDSAGIWWRPLGALLLLGLLVAFNHRQGLAIAAVGIQAVLCWRLTAWRRSMPLWLLLTAGLSSAAILCLPRELLLDRIHPPGGWLTSWYAFNLFSPGSPAIGRAYAIIGFVGVLNFAAAVALFRRNHVVAWLSLTPMIALTLPVATVPLLALLGNSPETIVVFPRLLFLVPPGLALLAFAQNAWVQPSNPGLAFASVLIAGLALVALTPGDSCFNRSFNLLQIPPQDLAGLPPVLPARYREPVVDFNHPGRPLLLDANTHLPFQLQIYGNVTTHEPQRDILGGTPAARADLLRSQLQSPQNPHSFVLPDLHSLFTPASQVAMLSGHWAPQYVAAGYAGIPELKAIGLGNGWRQTPLTGAALYEK
jgi:hypothetical protein